MRFNLILVISFLAGLSLISCSGEDGEQGIQGEQGLQGEQGIPGADGNTNVQRLVIDLSDIEEGLSGFVLDVPELTAEALQNHALLFYFEGELDGQTFFMPVPGEFRTIQQRYDIIILEGSLSVGISNLQGNGSGWISGLYQKLHVVMIESETSSMTSKNSIAIAIEDLKQQGVNVDNYQEVIAYFGLK